MNHKKINKIKRKISDLLNVPIRRVTNLAENKKGLFSKVVFAKVNGKKIVLKTKLTKRPYEQKTEQIALKYLQLKDLKISPALLAKSRTAIIQEQIKGNYFARSDPEIISLARALKELHSLRFEKWGVFGKGRPRQKGTIKDFFAHWFHAYSIYSAPNIAFFKQAKNTIFVKQWLPKIENTLEKHEKIIQKYLTNSNSSIIHLDLHSENVLVSKKGVKLIDWDNAQVGDPALDLAGYLNMAKFSNRQLKLFYSAYGIKRNHLLIQRINNYKIINQVFRLLSFARGMQGLWGPRGTREVIKDRMAINLSKFSELIGEPLPASESQKIILELSDALIPKSEQK